MGNESQSLYDLVVDRLERSELDDGTRLVVLAAFEGDAAFAEALQRPSGRAQEPAEAPTTAEPVSAYLSGITVQGFRGIGPECTLRLEPASGLTLVVGRNGSGKSSFAEAAEVALTGTSYRWKDKTSIWRSGWRNLHADEPPRVNLDLQVDGDRGTTTVARSWDGADVEDSTARTQRPGQPREPLESLGWDRDLATYRPFLSYSELGGMLEGRPSEMYDAIAAILGLERLADAEQRLNDTRKSLDKESKNCGDAAKRLREMLAGNPDPRARETEHALQGKAPDLDRLEQLAVAHGDDRNEEVAALRRLSQLVAPDRDAVSVAVRELRGAVGRVGALRGTDADEASRLADLLGRALDHHGTHGDDATCPVCGTRDVLDQEWAVRTRAEVDRLRRAATDAVTAHTELRRAVQAARQLISVAPSWLPEGELAETWRRWYAGTTADDPTDLADHLDRTTPALNKAVDEARTGAASRLEEFEDRWRPVALELAGWVSNARGIGARSGLRASVKDGYKWLHTAALELRNERLRPFAEESAHVWADLRQESNVDLGPIELAGSGNQRKLDLDVSVDGTDGTALGVMSQGELHALALALFLPRATADDSPFRFLIIDDPVQSMDPAKVDGLARVLARTAEYRQVVVFTHDARLPAAVRRLEIPATVWQVVRSEQSTVELRKAADPVARLLDDARVLVKTERLPAGAARLLVPALCREALEATFVDRARRRLLQDGVRHADVDEALAQAHGPYELGALAFFGDARQGNEVLSHINKKYGGRAGDTFLACKVGGHATQAGDLGGLVRDAERLTDRLRDER